MSKKRTIDDFFGPVASKKHGGPSPLTDGDGNGMPDSLVPSLPSTHPTYPFPIDALPSSLGQELDFLPTKAGRAINDQPDLDLLYFQPYVPRHVAKELFLFLRSSLPFYRVEYKIRRGGIETQIRTPRYTTVFGLDATSRFVTEDDQSEATLVDSATGMPLPASKCPYRFSPRPLPACLDALRKSTERAVGGDVCFNFCLVNYYASGADSISFHSDDERFLGPDPAIASFSLGAARDFLMKHKPPPQAEPAATSGGSGSTATSKPLKFPLESGDMILMRGPTQSNWLHSIPKRSGRNEADGGRINITFRKALFKAGTDNYYHYNVGTGPVHRWDDGAKEMRLWKP